MAAFLKKQPDTPRRRQQPSVADNSRTAAPSSLDDQSALFRRNRTLTGSISSKIGSAGESRSNLKSARVQAHELADQRRQIGGVLLVIMAVVILTAVLLWQFTADVVIATPGISRKIDTVKYQQAIQDYYGQNPFERLRFAANQQRMTDYVKSVTPEVEKITVNGNAGFASSKLSVAMRKPIAGWKIDNTQYYVDGQGVSFVTNYFSPPTVQIVDQSGVQLEPGAAIASNRFLGYVGRTVALAANDNHMVEQVIIPAGTTREIDLRIKGVNSPVKLLIDRPVGEQVEDMTRALAYFSAKGEQPAFIDVRVAGKAYYK